MVLTGAKVTEINKAYKDQCIRYEDTLQLNVGSEEYWSGNVYSNTWMVCKIDDISKMIRELETLRAIIEEKTGVIF